MSCVLNLRITRNLWLLCGIGTMGPWDHGTMGGSPWVVHHEIWQVFWDEILPYSLSISFAIIWVPDSAGFRWMIDEGKVCGWFLMVCCCFRITR